MNLSIDLINGILQYLGNRPYVEVAHLITGIQTEAAAQAPAQAPAQSVEETPVEVLPAE
jgi:hypothetical protein